MGTGSSPARRAFLFIEYFCWLNTNVPIHYYQLKQADGNLFWTAMGLRRGIPTTLASCFHRNDV